MSLLYLISCTKYRCFMIHTKSVGNKNSKWNEQYIWELHLYGNRFLPNLIDFQAEYGRMCQNLLHSDLYLQFRVQKT